MTVFRSLIALIAAALLPVAAQAETIALVNARVIDGTGAPPQANRTVIVEDGRIAAIFEAGSRPLPADTRQIDLQGLTLMPGLIDSHVHFMIHPDNRSSSAIVDRAAIIKQREADLRALLRSGITAVRELAGDARIARELQYRQASGEIEAPAIRFSAVFFGPPFLKDRRSETSASDLEPGTAPWSGVVTPELDIADAMERAKATGATGVKLYASLTADQLAELSREARRQGLLVWIHSVIFPTGTLEALAAGADTLVHSKGMITIAGIEGIPDNFAEGTTRQWGPSYSEVDPDGPAFRAAYADMVRQGTILEPALMADGERMPRPLPARIEAMRDWSCRATGAAHRAGVAISAGTDSVKLEPFDLQRELGRLVDCGLTPLEAIRAATQTNARGLGMGDTHGTVEVGKAADLIAVSGDPATDIEATRNVRLVIQAGRLVVAPD